MRIKFIKIKNWVIKIVDKIKALKPDKNDLFLFNYRLKNNDSSLRMKVGLLIVIIFITLITILFCIFQPLERIRATLAENYESYRAEDHTIKLRKKTKEEKENIDYSKLEWPISGTITSGYGYRTDPISGIYSKHTGIDISGRHRDFVKAVTKGTVSFVGSQRGFGNCIEIKHNIDGDIFYSFYAHLYSTDVYLGQEVNKGQVIAKEGGDPNYDPNPGYSTGHHLHFEIRTNSGYGNDIDPYSRLN